MTISRFLLVQLPPDFVKILRFILVAFRALCLCLPFGFGSAGMQAQTAAKQAPAKSTVSSAAAITFENVLKQSKIHFALKNSISPNRYSIETMTGGVALFDYGNDGLLDIFFTNGAANLLRFVVEQTLAGQEDTLKERLLGIEVFRRAPDDDTNQDPVVRLSAAEVRKRLALYYQHPDHHNELVIALNPGSYVPFFRPAGVGSAQPQPDLPSGQANMTNAVATTG